MPGLRPPLMPRRPKTTATTATAPRAGLGPGIRGLTMRDLDRRRHWEGGFFLVAFTACVPAANWMIGNLGTVCVPDGPCLIPVAPGITAPRSEEHTSELQSLMRISYAVFCLKKKTNNKQLEYSA